MAFTFQNTDLSPTKHGLSLVPSETAALRSDRLDTPASVSSHLCLNHSVKLACFDVEITSSPGLLQRPHGIDSRACSIAAPNIGNRTFTPCTTSSVSVAGSYRSLIVEKVEPHDTFSYSVGLDPINNVVAVLFSDFLGTIL